MVKRLPSMWETWVRSLGREDPLEKEMPTHSSTLAWKIPWTEEPCRLQSVGSQRVRPTEWLHFFFRWSWWSSLVPLVWPQVTISSDTDIFCLLGFNKHILITRIFLEKEMATHSSVLAWRIPGTAEPGGLPSMGSHRVGHDWNDLAAAAAGYFCMPHF